MDSKKIMRVGEAAKATGIKRTTIIAAIDRGEIRSYPLACGLPTVRLTDVVGWRRPKRGRPFAKK